MAKATIPWRSDRQEADNGPAKRFHERTPRKVVRRQTMPDKSNPFKAIRPSNGAPIPYALATPTAW